MAKKGNKKRNNGNIIVPFPPLALPPTVDATAGADDLADAHEQEVEVEAEVDVGEEGRENEGSAAELKVYDDVARPEQVTDHEAEPTTDNITVEKAVDELSLDEEDITHELAKVELDESPRAARVVELSEADLGEPAEELPEDPPLDAASSVEDTPFEFPTLDSVAAVDTTREGEITMTMGDESGMFESVSLGNATTTISEEEDKSNQIQEVVPEALTPDVTPPIEENSLDHTPSLSHTESTTSPPTSTSSPDIPATPLSVDTTSSVILDITTPTTTPTTPISSPRKSSKTPTKMQQVISLTRQRDLPPKNRDEEARHLRELEEMRIASIGAEKRRQSQIETAAVLRSSILASTLPTWEKFMLPNWRAALRADPEGVSLRKLWHAGTMPVRFRGRLWGMVIGNGLAIGKASFASCLKKANTIVDAGKYPKETMERLEQEIEETMPLLKLFQSGGVMHEDLRNILLAYSVFKDGLPHYPSGLTYPAAMLMINMTPPEAFLSLVNLVEKSLLKSYYSGDQSDIEAYSRIFDTLLADSQAKVYATFSKELVRPSLYLVPWISSVFIRYLPLDLATRLFDVFVLEGDSFLFRVALAVLQILEPRLFNPVLEELAAVFRGEDRGAVAVVRRHKEREEENGSTTTTSTTRIEVEEVYSEMGCTEERLFGILEHQVDWKEENFARLVERELP